MKKTIRFHLVLAATLALASSAGFAQSGAEALYKAKCASCHGATGTPSPAMAKAMGIKATTDPEVKKLTLAEISTVIKNGKGKMKPAAGLSDEQIKDLAAFYKGLK